ncbi:MAG: hypothetical protein HKN19_14665 [Halioglobus sp.]|nr:hypothetical protein [Halioglobus sp.]
MLKSLMLVLCLGLALATSEAVAQGKKKVAAPWVGKTAEGKPCKGGQPTSGPFDYLRRRQLVGQLEVVEEHHFNRNVENLIKGITTEPMGDIDFTLRSFPNHHRALNSAVKFRLRHKRFPPKSKGLRAECYLQRAINFSPNDPIPYGLLGYTFHKLGKPSRAVEPYKTALKMSPGDMMLKYNLALALTELERYHAARAHAEEVYDAGFPLPALKRRLLEAGHWEGATVPPKSPSGAKKGAKKGGKKGGKAAKAPKKLSKEEYVARALAGQKTAKAAGDQPAASDAGASNKEKFAAAVAAHQAQEAASATPEPQGEAGVEANQAISTTPDSASEAADKTLSNKERFAAAVAAQQAASGDMASGNKGAVEPGPVPTAVDGKPLTNKERFAAAVAAHEAKQAAAGGSGDGKAAATGADGKPLTPKERFAAAVAAAQSKKEKAPPPTLSDVDPETRKEQFAAKLAAKGLLEGEETAGDEDAEEGATSGEQAP